MSTEELAPEYVDEDLEPAGSTLEAVDISAWFGKHKVLQRVSLTMAAGTVTALIGNEGGTWLTSGGEPAGRGSTPARAASIPSQRSDSKRSPTRNPKCNTRAALGDAQRIPAQQRCRHTSQPHAASR